LPRTRRQFRAVHATRQVDVGEQDVDRSTGIDVLQRLVGGRYFVDQKAGCAQSISDKIADEDFVFDHQNRNRGGVSYHVFLPTSASEICCIYGV
jgi:hypothetical protein